MVNHIFSYCFERCPGLQWEVDTFQPLGVIRESVCVLWGRGVDFKSLGICTLWFQYNMSSYLALEKAMAPLSSTLAWKITWMEEPVGCGPWGREESDTTERLHFHFSLSCLGEGIGNPLQCSCLEHPRDGGAWWAAVRGVAQSRTRLSDSAAAAAYLAQWKCL